VFNGQQSQNLSERGISMKRVFRVAMVSSLFATFLVIPTASNAAAQKADIAFLIDGTSSMAGEINAVKNGLSGFVSGLDTASIDARFAVVLFGGAPEIVPDFTSSEATTLSTFGQISVNGAVGGFQNNHNVNPEAGLEAIRMVLGGAPNSVLLRNNVGGVGSLDFRPDARKNLILVTDEDGDSPFYGVNRFSGQSGFGSGNGDFGDPPSSGPTTGWQAEIDAAVAAIVANKAFINLVINAGDLPSAKQYGNPSSDVADANLLNFDPGATLANLIAGGFGESLEAQVLEAKLIGRSFNIGSVSDPIFVQNFFAAKVEEIIDNPVPTPDVSGTGMLLGIGLAALALMKSNTLGFVRYATRDS
jgi:hypothetical protein